MYLETKASFFHCQCSTQRTNFTPWQWLSTTIKLYRLIVAISSMEMFSSSVFVILKVVTSKERIGKISEQLLCFFSVKRKKSKEN